MSRVQMIQSFNFSRIPKIIFGPGKLKELFQIISKFGNKVLIVTGSHSLQNSGIWVKIESMSEEHGLILSHLAVSGEPSPEIVDDAVKEFKAQNLDLIVGIGGGSVIDTGKAISAMIKKNGSVKEYLEGVGNKVHDGEKLPYIAIPTTSGTGSEATKNAVISEVGPKGFKKSLRHDSLIPNIAIIDPELMVSCPSSVTAACGLDAFTQLLESYVSPSSSPLTDALALDGIQHVKDALIPATSDSASDVNVRSKMAYGALISGITLANAGLGVVHGFASSIGGEFNIPHGVVCGTLLSEVTRKNIEKLKEIGKEGLLALKKFAKVGEILADNPHPPKELLKNANYLVQILDDWTSNLRLSRLSKFGVSEREIEHLVEITSQKNNPVILKKMDLIGILKSRL
jgi:alcohol dehydrogenase class IV